MRLEKPLDGSQHSVDHVRKQRLPAHAQLFSCQHAHARPSTYPLVQIRAALPPPAPVASPGSASVSSQSTISSHDDDDDVPLHAHVDDLTVQTESQQQEQPSTRKRRRVTFSQAPTEGVACDCILTPEDRQRLWWTKHEIQTNRKVCRRQVAEYTQRADIDHQRELLHQVYKTAAKASKTQPLLSQDDKMQLIEMLTQQFEDCRGMHPRLMPTLAAFRMRYVKGLVDVQERLPKTGITNQQREWVLCKKSIKMTRASKALAKLFAYVDSTMVHDGMEH